MSTKNINRYKRGPKLIVSSNERMLQIYVRCKWCSISLLIYVCKQSAYICDVQTLSFETNYNYLFCITKYSNLSLARQQTVHTQKASCADTDLVVDSNPTELCIGIMRAKRQADLHHTTNIYSPADAIIINYTVLIFICQFIQCHVALTPPFMYYCWCCCCCCCCNHCIAQTPYVPSEKPALKSKNRHYLWIQTCIGSVWISSSGW